MIDRINKCIKKIVYVVAFLGMVIAIMMPIHASAADEGWDMLMEGRAFNSAIKKLVNGDEYDYSCEDSVVEKILFCPNDSIGSLVQEYESLPRISVGVGSNSTAFAYYDSDNAAVYIASSRKIQLNAYLGYAFSKFTYLKEIDFSPVMLSRTTYLHAIFYKDRSIKRIEGLDRIDVSNTLTMDNMFDSCNHLEYLDLSSWDVSYSNNLSETFQECWSLREINLEGWDTGNNLDFDCIFKNCHSLRNLHIEDWDTSKGTTMCQTFNGCGSLESLDLTKWNLDNIKKTELLFKDCAKLESVKLPRITATTVSIRAMFCGCEALASISCSDWDVSSVNTFDMLFYNCRSITGLDFRNWNTRSANKSK